jgi:hypothetical protein
VPTSAQRARARIRRSATVGTAVHGEPEGKAARAAQCDRLPVPSSLAALGRGERLLNEGDVVPVDVQWAAHAALEHHGVGVIAPDSQDDVGLILAHNHLCRRAIEDDTGGRSFPPCRWSLRAFWLDAQRGADLGVEGSQPAPASPVRQEAVGVIVTVSFLASFGSGTVTSTTPSCVLALIFLASTPGGSAIERQKDP